MTTRRKTSKDVIGWLDCDYQNNYDSSIGLIRTAAMAPDHKAPCSSPKLHHITYDCTGKSDFQIDYYCFFF